MFRFILMQVAAIITMWCLALGFMPSAGASILYDDGNVCVINDAYTSGKYTTVSTQVMLASGKAEYGHMSVTSAYDWVRDPENPDTWIRVENPRRRNVNVYISGNFDALTETSPLIGTGVSVNRIDPAIRVTEQLSFAVVENTYEDGSTELHSYAHALLEGNFNLASIPMFTFSEYDANDGGGKGMAPASVGTRWYGSMYYTIEFPYDLPQGMSFPTVEVREAAVPEPATLGFLGLGALGLLVRRRH